ncbi:hypothetical protein HK096_007100 [Nowakowskiella sp. JEL0078]|nr:hypothetical protein HK096_007100 [Nowakowskiella sp. JEL0078]
MNFPVAYIAIIGFLAGQSFAALVNLEACQSYTVAWGNVVELVSQDQLAVFQGVAYSNEWYSQCIPGATTTKALTTKATTTTTTNSATLPTSVTGIVSTSCNIAPVDLNATAQAKKLLCLLYNVKGNHIISGQHKSTRVSGPDYEMNIIYSESGKYPALRGLNAGDTPAFGSIALSHWQKGGIPMVGYHIGSPAQTVDSYTGSQMSANINNALTSGTADNTRLNQCLDLVAAQIKIVSDGGGAVLFHLFHEAGGTWFWWSMDGGDQYIHLWKYTFNYIMNIKGLHNIVWLHPYNGSPDASFYPGKAYVDVGGADTYASDHGALASLYNSAKAIYGSSLPIVLHENGQIPDPAQVKSQGVNLVLFNTWHTTYISDQSINPASLVNTYYNNPYVITLSSMPSLK